MHPAACRLHTATALSRSWRGGKDSLLQKEDESRHERERKAKDKVYGAKPDDAPTGGRPVSGPSAVALDPEIVDDPMALFYAARPEVPVEQLRIVTKEGRTKGNAGMDF